MQHAFHSEEGIPSEDAIISQPAYLVLAILECKSIRITYVFKIPLTVCV